MKKLTALLDKVHTIDENGHLHTSTSYLNGSNSSTTTSGNTSGNSSSGDSCGGGGSGGGQYSNNKNIVHAFVNKRKSVDSNFTCLRRHNGESTECLKLNGSALDASLDLKHRRSLSEDVFMFPPHTTPSDKARCHMLVRTNSRLVEPVIPESPTYSNITLRKVAETMFLKDPQYKPRSKEAQSTKSNPFTALAQLRGVKKIIGANASNYMARAGDLFSSCFEMTAPFLKELGKFTDSKSDKENEGQPKSLPNTPPAFRKDFKLPIEPLTEASVDRNDFVQELKKQLGTVARKYKASFTELSSHPLYKSGKNETETTTKMGVVNGNTLGNESKTTLNSKKTETEPVYSEPIILKSDPTEFIYCPRDSGSRILTRRGSSESGFFSCLNEDIESCSKLRCCCTDVSRPEIGLETTGKITTLCQLCLLPNRRNTDDIELSNLALNDRTGLAALDDNSTTISSMRSFDDLELSESRKKFICRHHLLSNIDIDARSIDMGLIQRLQLDSEIKNLMQKSQFGNQLLYCKNRTSSIYTDSSDDISSLAGSDSLLWDDRSYTTIPNTRSAQIAKIVEYFERKNQAFKPLQVPDFMKSNASSSRLTSSPSTGSSASSSSAGGGGFHYANSPPHRPPPLATTGTHFPDCYLDYSNLGLSRKYADLKTRADYEAFCLELEKKPHQQRIMVCEGAVRSKLPLFDKQMKPQPNSNSNSTSDIK